MGAFFLTDNTESYRSDLAMNVFHEMGFSLPKHVKVGELSIYVYSKMATGENNILSDKDYTLISVGTPIYKGKNYTESLSALLNDYIDSQISYNKLFGQYTIIFCHDDKVEILRDPLGSKHVFTDKDNHILSSHMIPACQCLPGNLHINREAFYEKLLTGFIMSPNTLFDEILQINNDIVERINNAGKPVSFIHTPEIDPPKHFAKQKQSCIAEQAKELQSYFESIRNYSKNGVDIGLSGGYDSRLVLACLYKYTKEKLHLHSHSTENVHKTDLKIARQMADYVGTPCHIVETKTLSHSDNIDEILRKSVLYFDGRSSFSIGGCGEIYTPPYRINSTESTPFTLTGVGGELYRNVFDIGHKRIRFDSFMKEKVFSANFRKAVPSDLYDHICKTITERAAARLNIDKSHKQSKVIAHRYYCEIMMPDGQGVALDAYNQVSCCAAPFLEPSHIMKGYEAIPLHHSGGDFEGQLINHIAPGLAAIPSSYGYPIGHRPLKARIKEWLRMQIPASMWEKMARIMNKNNVIDINKEVYINNDVLKEAYQFMKRMFPEINFTNLIQTGEDVRRLQFMAMVLHIFRERIIVQ